MSPTRQKVAFLLAEGYEDSEMQNPYEAIAKNGNDAVIIGLEKETVLRGKRGSISYTTHLSIEEADAQDYAAVIIPGGASPERLMENEEVLNFVREADERGIPLAAICHGPLLFAAAEIAQGRRFTSYSGIAEEVAKAGGLYADEPVIVDKHLITSRGPDDEPYFIQAILDQLGVAAE